MAYNKNLNQTGWFYHAPAKPKKLPPQAAPPPSQIPGLSYVGDQPEDERPTKNWIKDTDSKYIVLAKQGGRPDLLRFRTPKPPEEGPKGYPRCEWFYLEDNAIEAAQRKPKTEEPEKYEFLLPDYMVHHTRDSRTDHPDHDGYVPSSAYAPRRAPFEHDTQSAFERDGNPTDKTQKVPESRQSGYGVRTEKLKDKPVKHTTPKPERGRVAHQEYESHEKKHRPVFRADESDPTIMSKVLSFGYQRDWEEKKKEWEGEQQKLDQTKRDDYSKPEKMASEYQQGYRGTPPNNSRKTPSSSKMQNYESPTDKNQSDNYEKEPFKLNKETTTFPERKYPRRRIRHPLFFDDNKYNILGQPILPRSNSQS